jgi:putative DNA primase/helicase
VCALQAIREIDPNTGKPRQRGFHLDKDIDNLEHALKQRPGCRLVVIDPISSYMGDANSHNNAEVRGLLAPLSDLAARHRVAILCISHLNKGAGDAMYRVMGSLAFVAAARAGQ